jgi:hypothetical protein
MQPVEALVTNSADQPFTRTRWLVAPAPAPSESSTHRGLMAIDLLGVDAVVVMNEKAMAHRPT